MIHSLWHVDPSKMKALCKKGVTSILRFDVWSLPRIETFDSEAAWSCIMMEWCGSHSVNSAMSLFVRTEVIATNPYLLIHFYLMFLMGLSHERIFRRITRRMGIFSNTSRSFYPSFVFAPNTLTYALARSHTAKPQEEFWVLTISRRMQAYDSPVLHTAVIRGM